jgi:hypothetical protein
VPTLSNANAKPCIQTSALGKKGGRVGRREGERKVKEKILSPNPALSSCANELHA